MTRYRNVGLFLFLAAVWGAAFMAIKAGLGTPSDPGGFFETPVLFAAIRYDVAGVLMLGYAVYATDHPVPRGRDEWATVVVGSVLIMAGYHALLFIGETDPAVTSAAAAVIVSLSPVLTAGFARAFLPVERLTTFGLAGLLLGLVGVAILSDPDPNNLLTGGTVAKLLIFAAAICFALGSVLTRRIDADFPIETMEAWTMLGGAVLMHIVSVGIGESVSDVTWTGETLLAVGYLSVVASAIGFLVYFVLLERLGALEINLVSYVAPVFAALTGWLFRGEIPTVYTVVGFIVIFVGFLLLKRESLRRELPRLRRELKTFGTRE
ncbi:dmt(drug/metabolite transporter) superfamily permease [Halogeometricum borinquense DSM 11551]|uniref:DMT(Drug/metabolite transporter) superfamily permease n=1 Tax=Halogeometricum borinquense (strain ATCC 700274 / DSM 11551 / JCM 10706 / KCTC 4070 / PR3) TaxID=469382 RepID=E4NPC1_HALBP|nr:EamA family transporter [Halogeometricum borinquense]ADQ66476.1 DMT(drug/metabolite transporter) superfamily permease [Halogeometricum borinquense DSM 11551]ELY31195.1 dmt(drug/metabolite transporter) superfamily permease [Halogeometricum borinquense DSM 11551]